MAERTPRTRAGEALSVAGILIFLISLAMLVVTLVFAGGLHPIISNFANSPTYWLAGIANSFLIMGIGEAVTILNDIRSVGIGSDVKVSERLQGS